MNKNALPQHLPGATASWAAPYWEGVAQGELRYQKCTKCAAGVFPPRRFCPHCASEALEWAVSDGNGTVYSHTEVLLGALPEFQRQTPYIVGIVELAEGFRMTTRIVRTEGQPVHCDMPVSVVFDAPDVELPCFMPSRG